MNKKKIPFFRWFFIQLRYILKKPNEFFSQGEPQKFSIRSVWFGAICLCVGLGCQAIIEMAILDWSEGFFQLSPQDFTGFMTLLFPQGDGNLLDFLQILHVLKVQKQVTLVLLPFIAFFSIYLLAGVLHLMLRGLNLHPHKGGSYESTLQLVAYCQAPMFFSFLPLLGPIVAPIWTLILLFRGIKNLYAGGVAYKFLAAILPGFFVRLMWLSSLEMIASSLAQDTFDSNIKIEANSTKVKKKLSL